MLPRCPCSVTTPRGSAGDVGDAGLVVGSGAGLAQPGLGRSRSGAASSHGGGGRAEPLGGGVGREAREGTRIRATSTGIFRLGHRAWRAEEPRLILSLPRCLRRDYRVGFVDGFPTPRCDGVAAAGEPRGEGVPRATGATLRHLLCCAGFCSRGQGLSIL